MSRTSTTYVALPRPALLLAHPDAFRGKTPSCHSPLLWYAPHVHAPVRAVAERNTLACAVKSGPSRGPRFESPARVSAFRPVFNCQRVRRGACMEEEPTHTLTR